LHYFLLAAERGALFSVPAGPSYAHALPLRTVGDCLINELLHHLNTALLLSGRAFLLYLYIYSWDYLLIMRAEARSLPR